MVKKKKVKKIFDGIRKPIAPPTQRFKTDKDKPLRKEKYKKPIEVEDEK